MFLPRKSTLLAMAGAALLLGGCASIDDVKNAQATADRALSAAQNAQGTADQALSAARNAQQTADQAKSDAANANARIDGMAVKHHGQRG